MNYEYLNETIKFYSYEYIMSFLPKRKLFSPRKRFHLKTNPPIEDSLYDFPTEMTDNLPLLVASMIMYSKCRSYDYLFQVAWGKKFITVEFNIAMLLNFDFSLNPYYEARVFNFFASFVDSKQRKNREDKDMLTAMFYLPEYFHTFQNSHPTYFKDNAKLCQYIDKIIPYIRRLEFDCREFNLLAEKKKKKIKRAAKYMTQKCCSSEVIKYIFDHCDSLDEKDIETLISEVM